MYNVISYLVYCGMMNKYFPVSIWMLNNEPARKTLVGQAMNKQSVRQNPLLSLLF
jgi:hypothetical protein